MEERVGLWWHKTLTRLALRGRPTTPPALLTDQRRELSLLFRALGGAPGLSLDAAAGQRHGARRSWAERMSGVRAKLELAGVDEQSLRLPSAIDVYPDAELNQALYRWLAALCAAAPLDEADWVRRNQSGTRHLLTHYRGLADSYRRLVHAELQRRPSPDRLPSAQAQVERAIRHALLDPDCAIVLPEGHHPPEPVWLWLAPTLRRAGHDSASRRDRAGAHTPASQTDGKRRSATEAAPPDRSGGLLIFRPESIFSWTDYAKVQHEVQDNDDEDLAQAADDLDTLSIGSDERPVAKSLRMNLDLAPRADTATGSSDAVLTVPEWDFRRGVLHEAHCAVRVRTLTEAPPCELPERLRADQRRLQRQLAMLNPERRTERRQTWGDDIDLDEAIRLRIDANTGQQACFESKRQRARSLSCLLLADFSLSTEASIDGELRVIDVIRDSLSLFAESLSAAGDRFALYGFNSRQRHDVSMWEFKRFDETFNAHVRGRLGQVQPASYTRMGAAVRHASKLLASEPSADRVLLILTDGKPNDNDYYEGRYGIEDTRRALLDARRSGVRPFCVTVDHAASDYLPHMFGKNGFAIVKRPAELPRQLAMLYAQLTR